MTAVLPPHPPSTEPPAVSAPRRPSGEEDSSPLEPLFAFQGRPFHGPQQATLNTELFEAVETSQQRSDAHLSTLEKAVEFYVERRPVLTSACVSAAEAFQEAYQSVETIPLSLSQLFSHLPQEREGEGKGDSLGGFLHVNWKEAVLQLPKVPMVAVQSCLRELSDVEHPLPPTGLHTRALLLRPLNAAAGEGGVGGSEGSEEHSQNSSVAPEGPSEEIKNEMGKSLPAAEAAVAFHECFVTDPLKQVQNALRESRLMIEDAGKRGEQWRTRRQLSLSDGDVVASAQGLDSEVEATHEALLAALRRMPLTVVAEEEAQNYEKDALDLSHTAQSIALKFLRKWERYRQLAEKAIAATNTVVGATRRSGKEATDAYNQQQSQTRRALAHLGEREEAAAQNLAAALQQLKEIANERQQCLKSSLEERLKVARFTNVSRARLNALADFSSLLSYSKAVIEPMQKVAEEYRAFVDQFSSIVQKNSKDVLCKARKISEDEVALLRDRFVTYAEVVEECNARRDARLDTIARELRQRGFDADLAVDILDPDAKGQANSLKMDLLRRHETLRSAMQQLDHQLQQRSRDVEQWMADSVGPEEDARDITAALIEEPIRKAVAVEEEVATIVQIHTEKERERLEQQVMRSRELNVKKKLQCSP